MSTSPAAQTWASYIAKMRTLFPGTQAEFGERIGYDQSRVSEWLRERRPPTEAARVAEIAVKLQRNPLEAFVAAGMLTLEQAQNAIDEGSVRLLREVRLDALGFHDPEFLEDLAADDSSRAERTQGDFTVIARKVDRSKYKMPRDEQAPD